MALANASAAASISVNGDSTGTVSSAFKALFTPSIAFTIGTGSNGVQKAAGGVLSLSANTPVTIDLTNTTATTGIVGDATFTAVKLIVIENSGTANTNKPLTIGNAATNQFQGRIAANTTVTQQIGAYPYVDHNPESAGYTVNSSVKSFKLDPGANALTVNITIVGN